MKDLNRHVSEEDNFKASFWRRFSVLGYHGDANASQDTSLTPAGELRKNKDRVLERQNQDSSQTVIWPSAALENSVKTFTQLSCSRTLLLLGTHPCKQHKSKYSLKMETEIFPSFKGVDESCQSIGMFLKTHVIYTKEYSVMELIQPPRYENQKLKEGKATLK